MSTISILGCGWLGLPLAQYLNQKGYEVKGSVTSRDVFPSLAQIKVSPYLLVLAPEVQGEKLEEFFSCQVLIVNFPPERRADILEYLPAQIHSLITHIQKNKVQRVLFVSSTSVYAERNTVVYEHEQQLADKGSGKALQIAEEMLMQQKSFKTTVLRLGGLVGYDRMPAHYLSQKTEVRNAEVPLNVIHRDDCLEIIYQIIQQDIWGEIFNACADEHPLRREFYTQAALAAGIPLPVFSNSGQASFKIVNSDKLKNRLGYTFKYPDPLKMIHQGRDESGQYKT